MTENYGTWTGEAPEAAEDAPEAPGPVSWLPPSVQRAQALEGIAERQQEREAERARKARAEAAADEALGAYKAAAEARGEVVPVMALATGQGIGRSIDDVLAEAQSAMDREDGRAAARQRKQDGGVVFIDHEPVIHASRGDGWPESSYELDRLVRRADELHRDLVACRARTDYPAAVRAARDKSDPYVERAEDRYSMPMIYR